MEDGMTACVADSDCLFIKGTKADGEDPSVNIWMDTLPSEFWIVGQDNEAEAIQNTDDVYQWLYVKTDEVPPEEEEEEEEEVTEDETPETDAESATYITMGLSAAVAFLAGMIWWDPNKNLTYLTLLKLIFKKCFFISTSIIQLTKF